MTRVDSVLLVCDPSRGPAGKYHPMVEFKVTVQIRIPQRCMCVKQTVKVDYYNPLTPPTRPHPPAYLVCWQITNMSYC